MISAQFEKYSNQRAQVIARTEITSASTKATVDAWEQSGVVKGKEWYTAPDERVCDHCGAMHRKIIPVSEDFGKNGETLAGLKLGYRDID